MIGKTIKELRAQKGMSQEQLASLLGVQQTAVSYWESGKRDPNLATLKILTVIFDVDYNYLLQELGKPTEFIATFKDLSTGKNYKMSSFMRPLMDGSGTDIWIAAVEAAYYRFEFNARKNGLDDEVIDNAQLISLELAEK